MLAVCFATKRRRAGYENTNVVRRGVEHQNIDVVDMSHHCFKDHLLRHDELPLSLFLGVKQKETGESPLRKQIEN